ncbi:MAG: FKBP-type peptidyl-prolyl cis-trans isomerase [Lentimicrobiaceae bacterium]|nr:FKBP-type peptidyl-prolyl cis-trans isomerase [Lentimicrobiaceae bacterium]
MTFNLKSQNMTQEEKNSYAIGANIGGDLKNAGIDIKFDAFKEGFLDALKGENKFSMEEMQAAFENIQKTMEAKQNAGNDLERERGKQFLAENKKRQGVHETESGLQYEVIVMGDGPKPTATNQVKVHYTGKTIDGDIFDSSVQRGEPIVFGLNQVIRGWTEGLQLMPVGSKFMLYIPSDLAYGERGSGGAIKGGATLIFEVELLDIPK